MNHSMPGLPVHHQLPEFTQTHVHWVGDAIQPSHPPSSPSPPAPNPSQHQGLFQWVNTSHEVAKVLELQLQHQTFWWMFRVNFLRIDWFDLLAVQGTLKSLLQHNSSKASIFRPSAFFTAQLSHPYMTTGKTISLTRWTFVGKVMSLLFNMLSRFVIAFNFMDAVTNCSDFGTQEKSVTVSIASPSICYEVMRPDAMILVFWMLSFKPTFSLSSFTFIRRLFSSSSLSVIKVVSSVYLRLLLFLPAIFFFLLINTVFICLLSVKPWANHFPQAAWGGTGEEKIWNASRICVSSLRRGHANLLCIVSILVYVLPKWALSRQSWFQLVLHTVWHFSWCTLHIN